jgi:hypothetical protein
LATQQQQDMFGSDTGTAAEADAARPSLGGQLANPNSGTSVPGDPQGDTGTFPSKDPGEIDQNNGTSVPAPAPLPIPTPSDVESNVGTSDSSASPSSSPSSSPTGTDINAGSGTDASNNDQSNSDGSSDGGNGGSDSGGQ